VVPLPRQWLLKDNHLDLVVLFHLIYHLLAALLARPLLVHLVGYHRLV
jgi:hypothetical protein